MNHEAKIVSTVDQVLASYRDRLAAVGLRTVFRGIDGGDGSDTSSEARISVYEGDNWVDSLEFFVREDGRPSVTLAEVEGWLSQEIERLISDHPWGGGWEEV